MDILKGLNLGHKSAYDLTNQFHHVFWFGDLNYRIDMSYEVGPEKWDNNFPIEGNIFLSYGNEFS